MRSGFSAGGPKFLEKLVLGGRPSLIPQAASSKQQAARSKQQAASSKQQAARGKQQAASSKQQASSSTQHAASSKQQVASSKQLAGAISKMKLWGPILKALLEPQPGVLGP